MVPVTLRNNISRQMRALGDETRMQIVEHVGQDECCVCELMDSLQIPQSLLSFHLRVLKDAGLITDRREGRWAYYKVDAEALNAVAAAIGALGISRRKPSRKRRDCK